MSIRRLQNNVISVLRSGIAIDGVVQCVQELVENAIDAEATCVAVRLDLHFMKIQVIDNGHGIDISDFQLIGERYATSKCQCLDDLNTDSGFYGYRGEALSSICRVSRTVNISSRFKGQETTWSKTFDEGLATVKGIEKSLVGRPACGTTVTVIGFLHCLPVRRQALDLILEVEKVRRSIEAMALSNIGISFSLRNDATDTWCFQVPKTSSVVSTFAHVFGSEWSRFLRPVSASNGPYALSGHVASKGNRSKGMQFLFVGKRRIANGKLQQIINQLSSKGTTGRGPRDVASAGGADESPHTPTTSSQKVQTLLETYPVYVLHIHCPRDFYDFRLHPSKTVVEFQQFAILCELVTRTFADVFDPEPKNDTTLSTLNCTSTISTEDAAADVEPQIRVENCANSLHSLPAKRPLQVTNKPESPTEDRKCAKKLIDGDGQVTRLESQFQSRHLPLNSREKPAGPSTPGASSCPTAMVRYLRTPTLRLPMTLRDSLPPSQKPAAKEHPLRLPSIRHQDCTPLGKLILKKDQREKLKRALGELKKFSRQKPVGGTGGRSQAGTVKEIGVRLMADEIEPSFGSGDGAAQVSGVNMSKANERRFSRTTASEVGPDGGSATAHRYVTTTAAAEELLSTSCRLGTANIPDQTSRRDSEDTVHRISESPAPSACVKSGRHEERRCETRTDRVVARPDPNPGVLQTGNGESLEQPEGNRLCGSVPETIASVPPMQASSSVSRQTDEDVGCAKMKQWSDVPEPSETANRTTAQEATGPTTPQETADGRTSGQKETARSTTLQKETTGLETSQKETAADGTTSRTEVADRINWMMGVDHKSHRDFYIDSESGNSYFGRPPLPLSGDQDTSAPFKMMVSGNTLPLDLVSDNGSSRLSTAELPSRPWGVRIGKEMAHVDDGTVEDLLHTWKNPVYEADPEQMVQAELTMGRFLDHSLLGLNSAIKSYVFSKDIFSRLEVIAQLEEKFILCSIKPTASRHANLEPHLLVAFDQHAVHERIRLEEMIGEAEAHDEDGSSVVRSQLLESPLLLQLPVATVRTCAAHKAQLQKRGLEISVDDRDRSQVCIHRVPRCFVEREISECKMKRPSVLSYLVETLLRDLVEALEETGTFGSIVPKLTLDVLKSQACHGAIKFGERLSLDVCRDLMKMVAKCKLPFCCAHGRPSIVPLVDFNVVRQFSDGEIRDLPDLRRLHSKMKRVAGTSEPSR